MKRTKIVCTIGPSSDNYVMLKKMVKVGMNVARLNFSHGTYESHGAIIKIIRKLEKELHTDIGIIQDLQGPRIRVGDLPEDIHLKKGQKLMVVPASKFSDDMKNTISCQYERLYKDVKKGQHILIADGTIDLKITNIKGHIITTIVEVPGIIKSHKGINVPGATLQAPAITDKDKKDVLFGIQQKVSYVAMSFVKNAQEVKDFRAYMLQRNKTIPGIIAKIERVEAVKNIASIIKEVDAIMVARGDLGIEMPASQVPIIQKNLIRSCISAGKPMIVATQMLESMISNPRPTRAEVSDVAHAVFDHTDATMLSGESANGEYPLEAVAMMNATIEASENSEYGDLPCPHSGVASMAHSAEEVCNVITSNKIAMVVCRDISLETLSFLSSLRQHVPIMVLAKNRVLRGRLNLYRGVYPVETAGQLIKNVVAISRATKKNFVVFFNKKGYSIEKVSVVHLTKILG
ncbi:MAG: pyruvate kinase [bacterium]|nr:pyruvate kinase [bacterium]